MPYIDEYVLLNPMYLQTKVFVVKVKAKLKGTFVSELTKQDLLPKS